jgi:starch synthase
MVSRLFWQKGIDLAYETLSPLLQEEKLHLVVLGTGDEDHQSLLRALQERHPGSVAVSFAFDPVLAQLIYAGADMFLMPSRFEPCGLGQLIAQRYGAVPVVRRTGGLADTVEDAGPDAKQGTGFVFDAATPEALLEALERALDVCRSPKGWRELMQRGMAKDFSWGAAAGEYEALYEQARGLVSERG